MSSIIDPQWMARLEEKRRAVRAEHEAQKQKNQPLSRTKLKTYEVQYSVKWVNFTVEVKAESEKDAIRLAGEKPFSEFAATARNEEVSSLEDILDLAGFPRVEICD